MIYLLEEEQKTAVFLSAHEGELVKNILYGWIQMGICFRKHQTDNTQLASKWQTLWITILRPEAKKQLSQPSPKGLAGNPLDRAQGSRAKKAKKWLDPKHVPVWIHESAAYHTLLTSGVERDTSDDVAHWLY